jgi:hypothetical protein
MYSQHLKTVPQKWDTIWKSEKFVSGEWMGKAIWKPNQFLDHNTNSEKQDGN